MPKNMREIRCAMPSPRCRAGHVPLGHWAVVLPVRLLTDGVRGQLDGLEEVL